MQQATQKDSKMICPIEKHIAIHCDEPEQEVNICWDCESIMTDDVFNKLIEVLTIKNGNQFVCIDCSENYEIIEGV